MGIHAKIEWCDSTLNLQMGCDGCELWPGDEAPPERKRCYAGTTGSVVRGTLAKRRAWRTS